MASATLWALMSARPTFGSPPKGNHLDEIAHREPGVDDAQTGLRHALLGAAIKTRPVRPMDPRFPDLGDRPPEGSLGSGVFEQSNEPAGLHDAAQLLQCRNL